MQRLNDDYNINEANIKRTYYIKSNKNNHNNVQNIGHKITTIK